MIHPDLVAELLYPSYNALEATTTSHPGPIPTVIPTPTEYQLSTHHGHRTLWVLFALMTLSTAIFALLSWRVPIARRLFHITATLIPLFSALSYFAMAASPHAGSALNCYQVKNSHKHAPDSFHEVCRQVYWARYVGWALSTPLVLVNLCLLAGVSGAHTLMAVIANTIMVLGGMFAALGEEGTVERWGWFTISALGYVFATWHVAVHGAKLSSARGQRLSRLWAGMAVYVLALWLAYPIVWGITTIARRTNVDTEILIFAILDVLLLAGSSLWLVISNRSIAETNVEIDGYWSQGLPLEGRIRVGDED